MNLATNPRLTDFQRNVVKNGIQSCEGDIVPFWLDGLASFTRALSFVVAWSLLYKIFDNINEQADNLLNFCIWLHVIIEAIGMGFSSVVLVFIFLLNWMFANECENAMPWSKKPQERHKFMMSLLTFEKSVKPWHKLLKICEIVIILSLATLGWIFVASWLTVSFFDIFVLKAVLSTILYDYFTKLNPEIVMALEARGEHVCNR